MRSTRRSSPPDFTYQSKWSRERTEYQFSGVNVTIDRNAGYGYLAEFESIENDPSQPM